MFKDYLHFSIDLSVCLPVNIIQPTIEVFWKNMMEIISLTRILKIKLNWRRVNSITHDMRIGTASVRATWRLCMYTWWKYFQRISSFEWSFYVMLSPHTELTGWLFEIIVLKFNGYKQQQNQRTNSSRLNFTYMYVLISINIFLGVEPTRQITQKSKLFIITQRLSAK